MTEEEKQIGYELQGYIDSIRDMTLKEIAIKHLKKYHFPKFLAGLLVKFSYPLLLAKDYKINELEEKLANADYQLEGRDVTIKELEAQKKELQCCANCRYSYGGEEEPHHDCGYCHAMQCICKLKLKEHTSDIYRMWEDKCDKWEIRVN